MSIKNAKILIVDDEVAICKMLSDTLKDEGYEVNLAHDAESGMEAIRVHQPDIVFLDIWMPGEKDGMDVLKTMYHPESPMQIVMMSGHGTIDTAVEATKVGAWDFIEKPISIDKILITISNILSYQAEKRDKNSLLNYIRQGYALVGESEKTKQLKQVLGRMAHSQEWVFIKGEVGTGKNLMAKNIHYFSDRAGYNFVEFRCSNHPSGLMSYELFGYEKGAFVGAEGAKKGMLELANKGTLYLRDVGSLDIECQEKLLSFIKSGESQREGGATARQLDVRVVSSCSVDLGDKVRAGEFSEELFNRLKGAVLESFPLVERRKDVPLLVDYFSRYFSRESGQKEKFFSEKAMQIFENYSWPGNVRELKNLVERVYILAQGDYVDLQDLKAVGIPMDSTKYIERCTTFRDARAQFEKEFLLKKIAEHNGNISKTAESIGLERSYLHRKIKSYGID